jgi:uncharacterized protein YhaN
MSPQPVYPTILRQSDWNSKKGVVAKIFKEDTGLGAQLGQLYTDFNKVEWQYWYPLAAGKLPRIKTEAELDLRIQQAKQKKSQLTNLRADIQAISQMCETIGAKWAKSKLVPESSVRHVRVKMAAALDQLDTEISQIEGEYDDVRADLRRLQTAALKFLQPAISELEKHLPKVKKTPTVAAYNAGLHNGVRGVGVVLAKLPQYKALYLADWKDQADDDFMARVKDGKPVLDKVTEIEGGLKRLKAALPK